MHGHKMYIAFFQNDKFFEEFNYLVIPEIKIKKYVWNSMNVKSRQSNVEIVVIHIHS